VASPERCPLCDPVTPRKMFADEPQHAFSG
jgi:hypothetical protein